jgi:hypothetical protein
MVKQSTVLLSVAVICNVGLAFAQSPQFGGIPQWVVTKAVQVEWRRFSDTEMTCSNYPG